ncbi:DUF2892 domain-containing protein [Erwinia sp. CPCC 100877]|nr:DUF2892 domain-containing protein [Erwinia sp. CPCC 100877]
MKPNVGTMDAVLRIIISILLFSLFFFLKGNLRFVALVGFFPLITGLMKNCLFYRLLGINTCKLG